MGIRHSTSNTNNQQVSITNTSLLLFRSQLFDLDVNADTSVRKNHTSGNFTSNDRALLQTFVDIRTLISEFDIEILDKRLSSYFAQRSTKVGYYNLDSGRWKTKIDKMIVNEEFRLVSTSKNLVDGITKFLKQRHAKSTTFSEANPLLPAETVSWNQMRKLVWQEEFRRLVQWGVTPPSDGTLKCFCCLESVTLIDYQCCHLLSRAHGGKDVLKNLRVGCKTCNVKMKAVHAYEYMYVMECPGLDIAPDTDPIKIAAINLSRITSCYSNLKLECMPQLSPENYPAERLKCVERIITDLHQ
jgi:hypothetical protein